LTILNSSVESSRGRRNSIRVKRLEMSNKILVTPGEPAGVGPEITIKASHQEQALPWVVIADPDLMQDTANRLRIPLRLNLVSVNDNLVPNERGILNILPVALARAVNPGVLDKRNAHYVLKTLELATELCIAQKYAAVVTGPVQKSVMNEAGIAFSGHTEFFAEKSHTKRVVMLLATDGLRVALASTHIPLKDVPAAITREGLREILTILIHELSSKFGILKPRILVAGLNPHAGEGGHLGHEEIDTIIPVIESLKADNVELIGPLPADTLFAPHHLDAADCVLAMYHDQGLPVLKHKGFGKAVNITLGLPFIRTSVDHGTALDLAGKGLADENSLLKAMATAAELARLITNA